MAVHLPNYKSVNNEEQLSQCGCFVTVKNKNKTFNLCPIFLVNVNFNTGALVGGLGICRPLRNAKGRVRSSVLARYDRRRRVQ